MKICLDEMLKDVQEKLKETGKIQPVDMFACSSAAITFLVPSALLTSSWAGFLIGARTGMANKYPELAEEFHVLVQIDSLEASGFTLVKTRLE